MVSREEALQQLDDVLERVEELDAFVRQQEWSPFEIERVSGDLRVALVVLTPLADKIQQVGRRDLINANMRKGKTWIDTKRELGIK
jgi:hypothetical protein